MKRMRPSNCARPETRCRRRGRCDKVYLFWYLFTRPARERARIVFLLREKGRDTFAFQRALAEWPRLCEALAGLAARRSEGV